MKTSAHDKIHPVDLYVGQRLRQARLSHGWSQSQLGKKLTEAITFQQVQKYEKGINRVAASRLYEFACAFELPPSFFLPDCSPAFFPQALSVRDLKLLERFHKLPTDAQKTLLELLPALR